jgi:hypothetical protein
MRMDLIACEPLPEDGAGWLSYHLLAMARIAAVSALLLAASAGLAGAQGSPSWTEPFAPFRVAGNLLVGTRGSRRSC